MQDIIPDHRVVPAVAKPAFRKSSYSGSNPYGNCVQVARLRRDAAAAMAGHRCGTCQRTFPSETAYMTHHCQG